MAYLFKILSPIQKLQDGEDGKLRITGYASTAGTDRVGDVILPSAWTGGGLDNYKTNPIILFNHNYGKPIGRAVELEVDAKGLKISCEISPSAGEVHGLIKDSVLTTFSVGFMVKDADYNEMTDGYIIKDAELLEVSVVTVPCNQEALFSISKSLKPEELKEFKKEIIQGDTPVVDEPKIVVTDTTSENTLMDEETFKALAQKAAEDAIRAQEAAREAAEKKAAEKAADTERLSKAVTLAAEAATKSTEERLLADFDAKLKANKEDLDKTLGEFQSALEEKNLELQKMAESKRSFGDRSGGSFDITKNAEALDEAKDAFVLAKIKSVGIEGTNFGKSLVEKFNTHSGVAVGTDALERTVGTEIERDIFNDLILAPLFREIRMNSAQMTFPIMPDAGFAEITGATTASGTAPIGNLDPRGATYGAPYTGITLTEQTLSTVKIISRSWLGNETEEDTLIPILPLIRESMARSHARTVENMILAGNHADGIFTSGAADGLLKFASTNGRTVTAAGLNTPHTAATLFGLRKAMGKYGLNPRDIVYIVSQQAYFELIEDPEFADMDLVGNQASKLTGEVGRLYGSTVLMCDEFAPAGANRYSAIALNRRNFLIPRLRGMTVESDYETSEQRTVLVTSQRLGFAEVIPNAKSVVGLRYAAA